MPFLGGIKDDPLTLSNRTTNERTICALILKLIDESSYLIRRIVSGYCHTSPLLALTVPKMVRMSHPKAINGSKNIPMAAKIRSPATIEYMATEI